MRELDCDFCGGTAAGAYEVLPADLDPALDEQVRVVLCGSCRETLDAVLAPLLDRLGIDGTSDPGPARATDAAGHASPTVDGDVAGDGADETDDDPSLAIDAAGHSPPPEEPDGSTVNDERTVADVDHAAADDDTADAADDPTGDHKAAATTVDDGPDATEATAREEPADFRKVMRFLNNREFPVARAEVAEFAAGAYDLENEDVREIFDYAIERGILAEENGQLMKG